MRSTKIGSLYLTEYAIQKKKKKTEVHEATNHVFCCDISGSMYDSLPLMRKQLKNRIPSVVDKDDTVTIIVFSGKKECVVLKELVKVNDINDLKALNTAIDKFMVPTGCTCFLDPVVETTKLINKNNHGTFSWIFLSGKSSMVIFVDDVISCIPIVSENIVSITKNKGKLVMSYNIETSAESKRPVNIALSEQVFRSIYDNLLVYCIPAKSPSIEPPKTEETENKELNVI